MAHWHGAIFDERPGLLREGILKRQHGNWQGRQFSIALAALIVAGCGPSAASASLPPGATGPSALAATPGPFLGLRAPVAAPQTLTVINGYDNPIAPLSPNPTWCPSPGVNEHDHCNNQEDGLDLVPSNLADTRLLAPTGGTITWTWRDKGEPALADCMGVQPTGTKLNLTICHFDRSASTGYPDTGATVTVGTVLGLRNAADPWVHLSLDNRSSSRPYPPVPFVDTYSIEGHAFPSASPAVFDLYCGNTIASTNVPAGPNASMPPTPPFYARAPAIDCAPTPTPTRTPTATPKPTPSRASPVPSSSSSVAIVEFTTPTSGSGPNAIAKGPDGALWFTESIGNRIGRITTSGEITEFVIPTPGRLPIGIVAGPDGAIWFTENGANRIGRITISGAVTEYALPHDGNAGPGTIIVGPDGALWFTEQYGNRIGHITTAGQVTEWNVPTPNATPWGMTVGPDDNIWFTELDGSKLGRITGSGAITEFALPHTGGRPNNLVSGPDGALWVAEFNGNRITRVTVAGAAKEFPLTGSIGPDSIVVGPDGALWFTEYAAGGLGRITTSGELSEFDIPSGSSSAPSGIVVGPDGYLWFAELGAWLSYQDRIGRASLP